MLRCDCYELVNCFYGCFYSLIQSFHIAEAILEITFDMPRCTLDHTHMNGLNQIDVSMSVSSHAKNQ